MSKKILLIGGEGYIGNVVALSLLNQNYKITSIDNLIYSNYDNIISKKFNSNYSFINADINNISVMDENIKKHEVIILLAGLVGDPITKKYPKQSDIINLKGVKNIINICEQNSKKLIFVSTCSNYGLINHDEIADEKHILKPLSLYAKAKVEVEEFIMKKKISNKFKPTILRFATAFGISPRMRFDLTVNQFTRELFLSKRLDVFDADTWRPYCHVKDFASLIEKVIQVDESKVAWEIFNAGGNENNATKRTIINKISKFLKNINVNFLENDVDPRNYKVEFSKVNNLLDFKPKYSIEYGIEEIIKSMQSGMYKEEVNNNVNKFGNYEIG